MEAVWVLFLKALLTAGTLFGLFLIPLGLPGHWLIALLGLAAVALEGGWTTFWVLLGAAALAEVLEFVISLGLARRYGAGRAGTWGAFLGGLAGGILGTPWLPLIGSLVGAAVGAFAGAFAFELVLARRGAAPGWRAGTGAFIGVLVARILKLWLGLGQAAWLLLVLWGFISPDGSAD